MTPGQTVVYNIRTFTKRISSGSRSPFVKKRKSTAGSSSSRNSTPGVDHILQKVYEFCFESPEDRTRFLRLTQMYILNETYEPDLFSKGEMKTLNLSEEQKVLKKQVLKNFPIELAGALTHQVWVEFLQGQGWTRGLSGFNYDGGTNFHVTSWNELPILEKQMNAAILRNFIEYIIYLGCNLVRGEKNKYLSDHKQYVHTPWYTKNPQFGFGLDISGFYPFVLILAEHLHNLYC
eukprot:UN27071